MRVKARLLLVAALLAISSCGVRPDPLPGLPRVMLWAWERPERMGFLDPKSAGVAFLARTVSWRDGHVTSRPRYQPLELPPGTAVVAVIRLESFSPPLPDSDGIAGEILRAAGLPRVKAIEIDFDARLSERGWYAELVRRVRQRLSGCKRSSTARLRNSSRHPHKRCWGLCWPGSIHKSGWWNWGTN